MRRIVISFVLVACFTIGYALPSGAITNGTRDGDRHPEVGALIVEWEGQLYLACSGTLIAPMLFLTAAHCVGAPEGTPYFVTFDNEIDMTDIAASPLIPGTVHPHPDSWAFAHHAQALDVAVVVLDVAVTGIEPAQLPEPGLLSAMRKGLADEAFTAVGYGRTRTTRRGGPQSMVPVDGVRRSTGQAFWSLQPSWLLLDANAATGDYGSGCYGDSGGPHFLGGESSHLIVSITVTGDVWCKASEMSYRVDTPAVLDFIASFDTSA